MSEVSRKRRVPVAMQGNRETFDLSKQTIATTDFGVMTPIENKLTFPGDKFDIKVSHRTYLMPMSAPTFGTVTEKVRAFFVPIRILWKDWQDFISNVDVTSRTGSVTSSHPAICPRFTNGDLAKAFINKSVLCTRVGSDTQTTPPDVYDFICYYYDLEDTEEVVLEKHYGYFTFTPYGRHVFKLLNGLGYNFQWFYKNDEVTYEIMQEHGSIGWQSDWDIVTQNYSALPLLAWWRAYIDWVVPSRFIRRNHSVLLSILGSIYKGDGLSDDGFVKYLDLQHLLYLPYTYNNSDYFGQAFLTPYGYEDDASYKSFVPSGRVLPSVLDPNDEIFHDDISHVYGAFANNVVRNLSSEPDVNYGGQGSLSYSSGVDDDTQISALTIRSLGALQDMVNRGKLAGTKIQDYLRVTYGIEPSSDALDISTYLGCKPSVIGIGDVMSNADTYNSETGDGAVLGQYAGRAIGGNMCEFSYSADEHGFFFITHELDVKGSYTQGVRPEVTALDRLDFFQPEFDSLDVDAIAMRELYNTPIFPVATEGGEMSYSPFQAFGFTPRYSKYKTNFDSVLGDFRIKSNNRNLESWFFMRNFDPSVQGNANMWIHGINELFLRQFSNSTSEQYDKIFDSANNLSDHFYCRFMLDFKAYRKMKSLDKPLEFEKGSEPQSVSAQGSIE